MNPSIHEKSDLYCPHCLRQLTKVKTTGAQFCPSMDPDGCEYGFYPNVTPMHPPLNEERMLKETLHRKAELATLLEKYASEARQETKDAEAKYSNYMHKKYYPDPFTK